MWYRKNHKSQQAITGAPWVAKQTLNKGMPGRVYHQILNEQRIAASQHDLASACYTRRIAKKAESPMRLSNQAQKTSEIWRIQHTWLAHPGDECTPSGDE